MVLDELRLVQDQAAPRLVAVGVLVDAEQGVRRDDTVCARDLVGQRPPAASVGRSVGRSVTVTTARSGQNRSASLAQAATTLVGATISSGPASPPRLPCSEDRVAIARVCTVFPSPLSSARILPSWQSHSSDSQW